MTVTTPLTARRLARTILLVGVLLVAGCRDGARHGVGEVCSAALPCRALLTCVQGRCTLPASVADGGGRDAAVADLSGNGSVDGNADSGAVLSEVGPEAPMGTADAGPMDGGGQQGSQNDPVVPPLCYTMDVTKPEAFVGYPVPFCLSAVPWPRQVPTCWSPASLVRPDFAAISRRVESFVRESFMRPTSLEFIGWGSCAVTPAGSGRLVLSLDDRDLWSALPGFGAGGDRPLILGVGAPELEVRIIEAFIKALGLTYTGGRRVPSPPQLLPNEAGGIQVFFGRRAGGSIVGLGARCLDAGPAGSAPATALEATDCRSAPEQDWQWRTDGTLSPVGRPELVLEADVARRVARLVPARPGATEQVWAIKRAALHTDADKCVGVEGGAIVEGQQAELATCDGSANQEWDLDLTTGRVRHGDLCLTVEPFPPSDNPRVRVERCGSPSVPTEAQSFSFAGNNQMILGSDGNNLYPRRCLNALGDTNNVGDDLGTFRCSRTLLNGNDLFYFQGPLESSGLCLQVPAPPGPGALTLGDCRPDLAQRWDVHLRPIRARP